MSGAPIHDCYLDSSECILWPRQDTRLMRLLIEAGAKPSEKIVEEEVSKEVVSSSQVSFRERSRFEELCKLLEGRSSCWIELYVRKLFEKMVESECIREISLGRRVGDSTADTNVIIKVPVASSGLIIRLRHC